MAKCIEKDFKMATADVEHVLVVPTQLFHDIGYIQGFTDDVEKYLDRLLDAKNTSYRPRPDMEEDPSFKQLIPYVIFRHTDDDGTVRILHYARGSGGGESRLHAKLSIGIGGHISSTDAETSTAHPYQSGMQRELAEEIQIDTAYTMALVGLINDDDTEVGKVHLGIVHLCDVESMAIQSNEIEIEDTSFLTLSELESNLDRFETWSQICIRALFLSS